jgi:hypothetical protein
MRAKLFRDTSYILLHRYPHTIPTILHWKSIKETRKPVTRVEKIFRPDIMKCMDMVELVTNMSLEDWSRNIHRCIIPVNPATPNYTCQ